MHGGGSLLPSGEVATGITAILRSSLQIVVAANVAGGARNVGVALSQRKAECGVIKFSVGPLGDGVALSASGRVIRKAYLIVIGNACAESGGAIPIGKMAAVAICGIQRVVIADVAGGAGRWRRRRVRADQCESGLAVIERCRIPTLGSVAVCAIRWRERSA